MEKVNDVPPRVRRAVRVRTLAVLFLASVGGVLPDVDHLGVLEALVGPRGLHPAFGVLAIVCVGLALASLSGLFYKYSIGAR